MRVPKIDKLNDISEAIYAVLAGFRVPRRVATLALHSKLSECHLADGI